MWHVSISVADRNGFPLPTLQWSSTRKRYAAKRILRALYGVGRAGSDVVQMCGITLQSRRLFTPEEIALLPQDKLPDSFSEHPEPRFGPFAK